MGLNFKMDILKSGVREDVGEEEMYKKNHDTVLEVWRVMEGGICLFHMQPIPIQLPASFMIS